MAHYFRLRASCKHLCLTLTLTKDWYWKKLLKTFERSSKTFDLFSEPGSMTEYFLHTTLGGEAGAICQRRTMWLHLKHTSQRPCWLIVILCCMIFMIWCQFWMLCCCFFWGFFSVGRSICTVCVLCYKLEIQAKWGLMWNILGEKASRLVC